MITYSVKKIYVCRSERWGTKRCTPLHTVVELAEKCFARGGRVTDLVELVIDLCGVDIVNVVNVKGYSPLELLMEELVCSLIRFVSLLYNILSILFCHIFGYYELAAKQGE